LIDGEITSTSGVPTVAAAAATLLPSQRSMCSASAAEPPAVISCAVAFACSMARSPQITCAPKLASPKQPARPMPLAPPITKARRPVRSKMRE